MDNEGIKIEELIVEELEKIEKIQGDFFVKQDRILKLCYWIVGILLGYSFVSLITLFVVIFV